MLQFSVSAIGQSELEAGQDFLRKARQAMSRGKFAAAEQYVSQAEKLGVKYASPLRPFSDTPEKIRKDLARLQATQAARPQAATLPADANGQPGALDSATPTPQVYGAGQAVPNVPHNIAKNKWLQVPAQQKAPQWIPNPHVAQQSGAPSQTPVSHPLVQARLALSQGQLQAAREWLAKSRQPGVLQVPHDSADSIDQLIRRVEVLSVRLASGASDSQSLRAHADILLDQAQALGKYGLPQDAVRLAQQASQIEVAYAPGERTPSEVLRALSRQMRPGSGSVAGQLPAQLPPEVAPVVSQRNSGAPGNVAHPIAAKQHSLKLLSQAKAALDRQDIATAAQFVESAKRLGVPPSAYQPGELQPWALQMEIDRERKRRQTDVAAAARTMPSKAYPVQPGLYSPERDDSQVVNASTAPARPPVNALAQASPDELIVPDAEDFEVPEGDGTYDDEVVTGEGQRLFEEGAAAVKRGELTKARELFRSAWAFEQELDPESRQRLQDHLQLLSVATTPANQASSDTKEELEAPQKALIRKLYQEITQEQIASENRRAEQPKESWDRLKKLRDRVTKAEISDDARQQLLRRVEMSLDNMQQYIDANKAMIELDERNAEVLRQVEARRRMKLEREDKLAGLVEEFNSLMEQRRFAEAVVVAKKARELDAMNPIVRNMLWKSRFAERMLVEFSLRDRKYAGFLNQLDAVEESAIPYDDRVPIEFPKEWKVLTDRRMRLAEESGRNMSEEDRRITERLKNKVQVQFKDRPLAEVMETLAGLIGVNVFLDPQGMAAEGVTTDTPVSLSLTNEVSMRSALNLILEPLRLSYVVQDEVLRITSETMRRADTYTKSYPVADLVIPIPNFTPTYYMGLPAAIREAYNTIGYGGPMNGGFNRAPLTVVAGSDGMGQNANSSVLAQMSASGMVPGSSGTPQPIGAGPGGLGGGAQADFDSLIDLIINTVRPTEWVENGAEDGDIRPFENNLSLVIRQTEEVHREIADLLNQLRRMQDLQVTIEVRFITLNDNFFERIGVDFDFDIDDNTTALPGDDTGPSVTIGLDPAGNPTADLDLSFTQGSFNQAIPAFGGFDAASAANFGFAVLSDIEAFFVIQAAQGDSRTNVLQAPKVTLFNGQQANIADQASRPFVISVIPVVGDFAAAHQPVIAVLAEGTSLSVQAVVSNDRRFVRLTLSPFFSTIDDVETFTFEGTRRSNSGTSAVDPTDDTQTVQNEAEEIIEGTTVQLPTLAFTTVGTTVSVPDGGTILLGGIKRLREGRDEAGVPIVSKLPYINRLFKNVGIGRTAQSLMMMVTPRIIIQEEEEENLGLATP